MKKILNLIILIPFLISSFSSLFAEQITINSNSLKKFVVTAYYSPLPNQSFYLRGNYEDEKKLNGEGVRGASGKEVYPGMIAAPKTYAFGTKIYFEGIGVGIVDDRGGAIVGSGSRGYDCDRIDIWMGYGEQGLKRALSWGKRTIYGRILQTGNEEIELLSFDKLPEGKISVKSINNGEFVGKDEQNAKNSIIVPNQITSKSNYDTVVYFQNIMKNLGYYAGEVDGVYSSNISKAILDFQISNNIVASEKSFGAGFYGSKTRQTLNEKYIQYLASENEKKLLAKKKEEELIELDKKIENFVLSFGTPKENEIGPNIRKLQKTLKILGYFNGKDTAIYGELTKDSIYRYQVDKGLVINKEDLGAGMIGQKTLLKLKEDLKNIVIIDSNKIIELDS